MLDSADLVEFVAQTTGKARLRLFGRSMRPLLRQGMVVEIETARAPAVRGDILVYKTSSGLVAHRVLRRLSRDRYLTCGDAHPDRLEIVAPDAVLGRVRAIWSSDAADARRIDGRFFRLTGKAAVATRPARAFYRYLRRHAAALTAKADVHAVPAFRALVRATLAFEGGDYAAGVAEFAPVPLPDLLDVVKRHHASGFVANWLDAAFDAGVGVPDGVRESFRRVRLASALQAERVIARVRDVVSCLTRAGVDAIVLKGGARLASAEPGADLQFSGDVDVLVPADAADRAVAALRAAGYTQTFAAPRAAFYAQRLQHRAPLVAPDGTVPVELHVSLIAASRVTRAMTYEELSPSSRIVTGPAGDVRVLSDVRAAVHLAYHGRDFQVWRDIVLLARKLTAFAPVERARFDEIISRERRDGVRVRAAVAAADAIRQRPGVPAAAVARYLSWAVAREDLPRALRGRAHILEALVAQCPNPYQGVWHTRTRALGWLYNAVRTPAVLRAVRASVRRRGPAVTLFDGSYAGRARPNAASAAAPSTHSSAAP